MSVLYISTYISCIKSRITVVRHETMVIEHEISKGMYSPQYRNAIPSNIREIYEHHVQANNPNKYIII